MEVERSGVRCQVSGRERDEVRRWWCWGAGALKLSSGGGVPGTSTRLFPPVSSNCFYLLRCNGVVDTTGTTVQYLPSTSSHTHRPWQNSLFFDPPLSKVCSCARPVFNQHLL